MYSTRKFCLLFIICLCSISFVGCGSDPKDATKDNFSKAIQSYYDTLEPLCINGRDVKDLISGKEVSPFMDSTFKHLAKCGILEEKKEVTTVFGMENVSLRYSITDKGKDSYSEEHEGFYYGKKIFNEVVLFTEPTPMSGHTISRVKYTYYIGDIPEWAKDCPEMFEEEIASETTPLKADAVLILTNEGWVHEKLFQK